MAAAATELGALKLSAPSRRSAAMSAVQVTACATTVRSVRSTLIEVEVASTASMASGQKTNGTHAATASAGGTAKQRQPTESSFCNGSHNRMARP